MVVVVVGRGGSGSGSRHGRGGGSAAAVVFVVIVVPVVVLVWVVVVVVAAAAAAAAAEAQQSVQQSVNKQSPGMILQAVVLAQSEFFWSRLPMFASIETLLGRPYIDFCVAALATDNKKAAGCRSRRYRAKIAWPYHCVQKPLPTSGAPQLSLSGGNGLECKYCAHGKRVCLFAQSEFTLASNGLEARQERKKQQIPARLGK